MTTESSTLYSPAQSHELSEAAIPIPRERWALQVVFVISFFWSTSSLMVFSVLPAFMTEQLGISHSKLGLIEGVAISLAFLAKVFSGILSDAIGNRRFLLLWGSVLTTLSKPLFALSVSATHIFWIRSIDRFGKGIRSSPTDALIADLSHESTYGGAFGSRQACYTAGAIAGSFLAMVILAYWGGDFRFLFSLAIIPSVIALLLIQFSLKPSRPALGLNGLEEAKQKNSLGSLIRDARRLPAGFWFFMTIVSFLMVARFSEAFLTLRARELGLGIAQLPLITMVMDVVHAAVASPFGKWADRYCRDRILEAGLWLQCASAAWLYLTNSLAGLFVAIIMIGLYMGITQGVMRALVAAASPAHLRGTAFAIFYFCSGIAVLIGNSLGGMVSDCWGLSAIFIGGMLCTGVALVLARSAKNQRVAS